MAFFRAASLAVLAVGALADLKRKEGDVPQRGGPGGGARGPGEGGPGEGGPGWGRPGQKPREPDEMGFLTSAERTLALEWTPTTRTVAEALEITFPKQAGWPNACFREAGCTALRDSMQQRKVALWVERDLLAGPDPFGASGGQVLVPQPTANDTGDQLDEGHYAVYSRRQVCFIVAKSLLGAGTVGYDNGLARILNTTVPHCGTPSPGVARPEGYEPSALTGEFGMTLWALLSACAADPTLRAGGQGPSIIVAKASRRPEVDTVRMAASTAPLAGANLSACRYNDGDAGPVEAEGLRPILPLECRPPTVGAPGRDFMTGGASRGSMARPSRTSAL